MRYKPLNKRVLLKPVEREKYTTGGIALPDTAGSRTDHCAIVVDPGDFQDVKEGDKVYVSQYVVAKFQTDDNKEYWLVESKDILCKVITK